MKIGIIGHGEDKFNLKSRDEAISKIIDILKPLQDANNNTILVSGHSPVGGIDIWAEWVAHDLYLQMDLKIPKQNTWNSEYGYKQRNLDIAKDCDELHVILVKNYPKNYEGLKFPICYHCKTNTHIKSGACWTANQAKKLGKKVIYHFIENKD